MRTLLHTLLFITLCLASIKDEQKKDVAEISPNEAFADILNADTSRTSKKLNSAYEKAKEGERILKDYIRNTYNMVEKLYKNTNLKDGKDYYKVFSTALTPEIEKFGPTTKAAKAKMEEAASKIDKLFDDIVADIETSYPKAAKFERPASISAEDDLKAGYKKFCSKAEAFLTTLMNLLEDMKAIYNKDDTSADEKKLVDKFLATNKETVAEITHLEKGIKGSAKTVKEQVQASIQIIIDKYLKKAFKYQKGYDEESQEFDATSENEGKNDSKKASDVKEEKVKEEKEITPDKVIQHLNNDSTKSTVALAEAYALAKDAEHDIKHYIKYLFFNISDIYAKTSSNADSQTYYKAYSNVLTPMLAKFKETTKTAKEKVQKAADKIDMIYNDVIEDIKKYFPKASKYELPMDLSSYDEIIVGYKTFLGEAETFVNKVIKLLDNIKASKDDSTKSQKALVKQFLTEQNDKVQEITHLDDGIKGTSKVVQSKVADSIKQIINKYMGKITGDKSVKTEDEKKDTKEKKDKKKKKDSVKPDDGKDDDDDDDDFKIDDDDNEADVNGIKRPKRTRLFTGFF